MLRENCETFIAVTPNELDLQLTHSQLGLGSIQSK